MIKKLIVFLNEKKKERDGGFELEDVFLKIF